MSLYEKLPLKWSETGECESTDNWLCLCVVGPHGDEWQALITPRNPGGPSVHPTKESAKAACESFWQAMDIPGMRQVESFK